MKSMRSHQSSLSLSSPLNVILENHREKKKNPNLLRCSSSMPRAKSGAMAGATRKERDVASILLGLIHDIPKFDGRNVAPRFSTWNGTRKRSFCFFGAPRSGGGLESISTRNCPLLFSPSSSSGDEKSNFLLPPPPFPSLRCSLSEGFKLGRKDVLFLGLNLTLVKDDFHSDAKDSSPAKKRLKNCYAFSKSFEWRKDGFFLDLNSIPEVGFPSDDEDIDGRAKLQITAVPGKKRKSEESAI